MTATTISSLLSSRAGAPTTAAFYFFKADNCYAETLSYAKLDEEARCIAASLMRYKKGARVAISLPTGPGFLRALFGIFYAGLVAVPIPELRGSSQSRLHSRALNVIRDAKPVAAFLPSARHAAQADVLGEIDLYDADDFSRTSTKGIIRPVSPESLALLQYSSGTSGEPKGVLLSHQSLMANLNAIQRAFGHSTESRGFSWLPLFHDMGLVGGVLQPLYAGFPVCLMRHEDFARRPLRWLRAISDFEATTSGGPGAAYDACVRASSSRAGLTHSFDLSNWNVAFVGAEPIHRQSLESFAEEFAPQGFSMKQFLPCYGLAEHTLMATAHTRHTNPTFERTAFRRSLVSCGWAVEHCNLIIADPKTGKEVPEGSTGEIWVSGPSVGSGYWRRPEETAKVFGARCDSKPGEKFLRTLDLGFIRDRRLFVTGRLKNLIIISGQNYEPESIEQLILESNLGIEVQAALVFGADNPTTQLIALLEIDQRAISLSLASIEDRVRAIVAEEFELSLGEVVFLKRAALLRTSSGKLRRCANASAYHQGDLIPLNTPPRVTRRDHSMREDDLCQIISDELGVTLKRCREAKHLASIGMDSLKALALKERIAQTLSLEISLIDLLTGSSLAELASKARQLAVTADASDEYEAQESLAQRISQCEPSRIQCSIWFAHQLDPGVGAYNLSCTVSIIGDVRHELLARAVGAVVEAHSELRARYINRDGTLIKVIDDAPVMPIEIVEQEAITAFRNKRFDLAEPPLMRVGYSPSASDNSFLAHVTVHHIAADYASMVLVVKQVCETYKRLIGRRAPELTSTRPVFTSLLSERSANVTDFPIGEYTRLLSDQPRRSWHWQTSQCQHVIDDVLVNRVRRAAEALDTTPFVTMLASLVALVYRHTGDSVITVGVPMTVRPVEGQYDVGCFVSLIPVSASVDSETRIVDLTRHFTRQVAQAIDNERRVTMTSAARSNVRLSNGEPPLCNIVFAHYPEIASQKHAEAGWRVESINDGTAVFELFFSVGLVGQETTLKLAYANDRFERETANSLMQQFLAFLAAGIDCPKIPIGDLDAVGSEQQSICTTNFGDEFLPIVNRFARQVTLVPDRIALVHHRAQISYAALSRQSQELAARLKRLHVGRESVVGICLSREPVMVAAMLAVLGRGATYVPIDPDLPPDRLRRIIADSKVRLVVTANALCQRVQNIGVELLLVDEDCSVRANALAGIEQSVVNSKRLWLPAIHPEQIAYVLYTSGSTGKPKGVEIRHAGVSCLMNWAAQYFRRKNTERIFAATSLSFDLSVFEMLAPLCHGGTVILADSIGDLAGTGEREAITLVNSVPSALEAMQSSLPCSVHTVNLAGEAVGRTLLKKLFATDHVKRIFNLYGPTEDTTYSTASELTMRDTTVWIGKPLPQKCTLVCDNQLRPAPVGAPGEICLAGVGLARGYVAAPRQTAWSFVPHPFAPNPGERLYRSGDRGRMSTEGRLRFDGRHDRQLKLRGYRIEPGEIEHVIADTQGVDVCAVVVDSRNASNKAIFAFIVPVDEDAVESEALVEMVSSRAAKILPHYMLPSRIITVDRFPLTANGKLDQLTLLKLVTTIPGTRKPPRNELEKVLLSWWQGALRKEFGTHDNLFLQGADSLQLLRFTNEIRRLYGVELSVGDAFRSPCVAAVSALVDARRQHPASKKQNLLELVDKLSDEEARRMLDTIEGGNK